MIVFKLLFYGFFFLVISYLLGLILSRLLNINSENKIGFNFISIVIGSFSITIIYSIICSYFNTINSVVIGLILVYLILIIKN